MPRTFGIGLTKKGHIYSDQKCRLCGGKFGDNGRVGLACLKHPKEKRQKLVPMLADYVKLVQSFPQGEPEDCFFRTREKKHFGGKYLYIWWKQACKNLGIGEVDLYGWTWHRSAIALKKYRTPEENKGATRHATNKTFERYFWIETEDLRAIYGDAVGRGIAQYMKGEREGSASVCFAQAPSPYLVVITTIVVLRIGILANLNVFRLLSRWGGG